MKALSCFLVPAALSLLGGVQLFAAPVIVHEWGTFTCLQDDEGHAIGGINVDDEPVPSFVEQYANRMVASQYSHDQSNFGLPPYNSDGGKGWTPGDPNVTMRLETPVIYFYPPKGEAPASVPPLDIHVDFYGGVLSQFYPHAQTSGALLNGDIPYLQQENLSRSTMTGLTWKGVKLTNEGTPIATDDKVWKTPREVGASLVQLKFQSKDGTGASHDEVETEKFLFYRGVGCIDSPLRLKSAEAGDLQNQDKLIIWPQTSYLGSFPQGSVVLGSVYEQAWLVEIHADGTCAFHTISAFGGKQQQAELSPDGKMNRQFEPSDFTLTNSSRLKASMQQALVKAGLYPDEASAMLHTWELSYFRNPGLRFFFLAPQKWVDKVLPLTITGAPTDITRVMIGRIELIDSDQKAALARFSAGPCPDLAAFKKAAYQTLQKSTMSKEEVNAFYTGEKPLAELGISIPSLIRDYLSLGRFRDALVVHQQREKSTPALIQFIRENMLSLDQPLTPEEHSRLLLPRL